VKFPLEMKRKFNKTSTIFSKYWELYTTLLNQLWSRNLQKYKYIMHWLSPFFHMETKFGPSEKKNDIRWDKFFQNRGINLFWTQKNEEILEKFKLEPVDKNLRKYISNRMPKKCSIIDQMDRRRLGRPMKILTRAN